MNLTDEEVIRVLEKKYDLISGLHGKENEFSQALTIALQSLKDYGELKETKDNLDRVKLINGEYQCEHIKEDVIDANCVWCALTVAEKGLETQRKKYQTLKKRVDEERITRICEIVFAKYGLQWASTNKEINEKGIALSRLLAHALVSYLRGEEGGKNE